MRMIDADALKDAAAYVEFACGDEYGIVTDFIDAAPTVSCEGCGHWSPNDYGSGECSDTAMSYINEIWTEQMETAPDFACSHFEAKA
jgi:hypothetical protein